ncbi:MAG: NAD(P)H-dependent glycerol-3-phosphate dehydrogenase [Syntrophomonadales bacterium]|jgi:glycerol-3-phosphate dehydrogenase (NAD(P)+)
MKKVTVLGAGSWGTALAILLQKIGHDVTMWGRTEDGILDVARERVNPRFLPEVTIPEELRVTDDLDYAMSRPEILVLSVPSQALRSVLKQIEQRIRHDVVIVNTAKGLEVGSHLRMSEVVYETLGPDILKRFAVLSGPSHAEEVGRGIPTAVVAASSHLPTAELVQDVFMSRRFRVYTSQDVTGVEMGGSLKNIIALATGISEGLGFGDNTKAALLTRGLVEIIRMGVQVGAEAKTFAGLSGIGDLVVTCSSRHSRNGRAGVLIGRGCTREQAIEKVGMVVEGIMTTKAAYEMSQELGVEMPITNTVYEVLFKDQPAGPAVWKLMERDKKKETLPS